MKLTVSALRAPPGVARVRRRMVDKAASRGAMMSLGSRPPIGSKVLSLSSTGPRLRVEPA